MNTLAGFALIVIGTMLLRIGILLIDFCVKKK